MGWMVFQVQTGYQVNWAKLDHLEREEREVRLVFPVLLGQEVLQECIKARTCVPTPALLV